MRGALETLSRPNPLEPFGQDLAGLDLRGLKLNADQIVIRDVLKARLAIRTKAGADIDARSFRRLVMAEVALGDLMSLAWANRKRLAASEVVSVLGGTKLSGSKRRLAVGAESSTTAETRMAEAGLVPLAGVDLRGSDLSGAGLRAVDFQRASLDGAILINADLARADLRKATLTGADLSGADVTSANLESAKLTDAVLDGTVLTDANLALADLSGIKFGVVAWDTDRPPRWPQGIAGDLLDELQSSRIDPPAAK